MRWNRHYNVEGTHAILSCSQNAWIRKTDEEFDEWISNSKAAEEGTELHAIAASLIKKRIRVEKEPLTFNMYVNDAIGFKMSPEVVLYYSPYCYGTADSIVFNEKKGFLRIHDLKTGKTPAHFEQLTLYASLFCMEYGRILNFKPGDIETELRIYQNNDIRKDNPGVDLISHYMDLIVARNKRLTRMLEGE